MSHSRTFTMALCAMVALASSPLRAQFPDEVSAGARVRVWLPEAHNQAEGPWRRQLVRGSVESVSADTLRISLTGASGTIAVPRVAMRRLEVSRGVSRSASAFERAAGGAIGGAISWGIMNDPRNATGPHYRTDWRAAGVGAAWGAGIGAVIGLLFPYERWHRVDKKRY